MEDLIFRHRHRRSALFTNMAVYQPANQLETPIFIHNHTPIKNRLSKINIIASKSDAANAVKNDKQSKASMEKVGRDERFGLHFGISKSYSSSLHLKVSPTSSIIFDRRNISTKLSLVPVVQPDESKKSSGTLSSTSLTRKYSPNLEKYQESRSATPTNSDSDIKCNIVKPAPPERTQITHPNQDFGFINPLKSYRASEIAENADEKISNQLVELDRAVLKSRSVERRAIVVRQLPLSYSMGDLTNSLSFLSKNTQCYELSDDDVRPPSRDTVPDPPFITLRKAYEEVSCPHASTCRSRELRTGISPQLQRMGIWALQDNLAYINTRKESQMINKSLNENEFRSQNPVTSVSKPMSKLSLPNLWDMETTSVNSFSSRNSMVSHWRRQSHQYRRRRYRNQDCKRSKTHGGSFKRKGQNEFARESSVPISSGKVSKIRTFELRRSIQRDSGRGSPTFSRHRISGNEEISPTKKLIKPNGAEKRGRKYQMHTISSIQKMRERVHPQFDLILAAWR